jgi:signal peptidase I
MTINDPLTEQPIQEQALPAEPEKKTDFRRALVEILQTLLLAVLLYFAIDAVFARVRVVNISMQPTFVEGDVLLVNKLAYKLGKLHTGDVVIFHNPNDLEEDYIKRLIGKPGDVVRVEGGVVFVNDTPLEEEYISDPPYYSGEWIVPEGSVFVLGDNRNQSSDSHSWGYVPLEDLVGKALVVYWPFDAVKVIKLPDGLRAN